MEYGPRVHIQWIFCSIETHIVVEIDQAVEF